VLLPTTSSVVSKLVSNGLIKQTGVHRSVVQSALVTSQTTQKSSEFLLLTGYTATSMTKIAKHFGATPALPPRFWGAACNIRGWNAVRSEQRNSFDAVATMKYCSEGCILV
jgi:hypothetical protein